MKKLATLGKKLNRAEQKKILGGVDRTTIICCCLLNGQLTTDCIGCVDNGQPNDCVNCANSAYTYCSTYGYTGTSCGLC